MVSINKVDVLAFDASLEIALVALKAAQAAEVAPAIMLGTIKGFVFSEALFTKSDRPKAVKEISKVLGHTYSMNQVRSASAIQPDLSKLVTKEAPVKLDAKLTVVDELIGSAEWVAANPPADKVEQEQEPRTLTELLSSMKAQGTPMVHQPTPPVAKPVPAMNHEQVAAAVAAANLVMAPENEMRAFIQTMESNYVPEVIVASLESYKDFMADVEGPAVNATWTFSSTELQKHPLIQLWVRYFTSSKDAARFIDFTHYVRTVLQDAAKPLEPVASAPATPAAAPQEAVKPAAPQSTAQPIKANKEAFAMQNLTQPTAAQEQVTTRTIEEVIHTPVAETVETLKTAAGAAPALPAATSFTGTRDAGIGSGWVAAGAAVVGAILETGIRGEVTVGSGIGAAVGIGAAYFGGKYVDEHVNSEFGRYVAAGTLGLAAGSLGSSLGRMAGGERGPVMTVGGGYEITAPTITAAPQHFDSTGAVNSMFGFK